MSDPKHISVADTVTFSYKNRQWTGAVVKKGKTAAHVITDEAREFRVPYQWLTKVSGERNQSLPTSSEMRRVSFTTGERVSFAVNGTLVQGVIARLNPQRAHIVADDGREYRTSYGLLRPLERSTTPTTITRTASDLAALAQVARTLLDKYQLPHWSFQFDNGRKRAGCCQYGTQVISLSYEFAKHAPDDEITDTLLHEIAHALAGKTHNHDDVWRATALEIGCSGRRCHDVQFTLPRYIVKCAGGCWIVTAERRQRNVICKYCRGAIVYVTYTEDRWREELAKAPSKTP